MIQYSLKFYSDTKWYNDIYKTNDSSLPSVTIFASEAVASPSTKRPSSKIHCTCKNCWENEVTV